MLTPESPFFPANVKEKFEWPSREHLGAWRDLILFGGRYFIQASMPGKIERIRSESCSLWPPCGRFYAGIDIGYNGIIGCLFIKNSVRLVALVLNIRTSRVRHWLVLQGANSELGALTPTKARMRGLFCRQEFWKWMSIATGWAATDDMLLRQIGKEWGYILGINRPFCRFVLCLYAGIFFRTLSVRDRPCFDFWNKTDNATKQSRPDIDDHGTFLIGEFT